MSDRAEEVLRMEHITKQFGSVYANRDVSFDVLSGEVHTLLGEYPGKNPPVREISLAMAGK